MPEIDVFDSSVGIINLSEELGKFEWGPEFLAEVKRMHARIEELERW